LDGSDNLITIYIALDYNFFITLRDFDNNYETEFVARLKKEIVLRFIKIGFKKEHIRFL